MKRVLLIFIVFAVLIINSPVTYAEPSKTDGPPQIDDGAFILIDAKSGEVLYQRNPDERLYPASTTKTMTAILALEMGDLNQVMTASQSAVDDIGKDGSNIGIMAGEQIKMGDLLKALLICSANETANIIAENLCPTKQDFVDLMNKKARELGCTGTHFVNPCGSHDPDHYTTPADLAKIARYAMTIPAFREIVDQKTLQMPPTNKHDSWPLLASTNKLLSRKIPSGLYTINGVKTGYTGPAGYNLVTDASDDSGMELISVIMHVTNQGGQENVRTYTERLLDYGFSHYSQVTLQSSGKIYSSTQVANAADTMPLDLVTKGEVQYVLPKDYPRDEIKEISHIKPSIAAPVKEGDNMGYIDYQKDGSSIGKVDLVAARSVELKPKPHEVIIHKVKGVLDNLLVKVSLGAASVLILFLILRLVLRLVSRRVNSRRL